MVLEQVDEDIKSCLDKISVREDIYEYITINQNTPNFSLHDSRLSKAYIKDKQDVIFEFDKDGTYIFDSNKKNPYDKTLLIKG